MAQDKKSQITAFIIIGLVLIIVAASLSYMAALQKGGTGKDFVIDIKPVKQYLDGCLETSSKKALVLMGLRSGKRILEEPYFRNNISDTNFLYDQGKSRIDSFDEFRINLGKEIKANLEECFMEFPRQDFTLEEGDPDIFVESSENTTQIYASWIIDARKEKSSARIEGLEPVALDLRLGKMYDAANDITASMGNSGVIEFDSLLETGMNITVEATSEIQLFIITDPYSIIDQENYKFIFATRLK